MFYFDFIILNNQEHDIDVHYKLSICYNNLPKSYINDFSKYNE